ncbi:DUF4386 domain-containing protein [candidate division KSB1 bacterium]
MDSNRWTARIAGILFIIATVAYSIGSSLIESLIGAQDNLIKLSANENQVIIGALLVLIDAVAVAGIAVVLYPVLKKYNEALALGYVSARIVEAVLFFVNVITILTLLTLSHKFVQAGAPDASYYQTLGALLHVAANWTFLLGFGLAFTLSALILNYVLYQSKLIPQWLSVWGLVGAVLIFAYYLLQYSSGKQVEILFLPIAVQEMVFAVWLIAKGFNPSAIVSRSA